MLKRQYNFNFIESDLHSEVDGKESPGSAKMDLQFVACQILSSMGWRRGGGGRKINSRYNYN